MKRIESAVQKVLNDNTSGSTNILCKVNGLLKKHFRSVETVSYILYAIKNHFPEFAAVNEYSKKINNFIAAKDLRGLENFVNAFEQKNSEKILNVYEKNANLLSNIRSAITLSNSKTIELLFTLMAERNKLQKVYIAESRPKFEGRILAKALLKKGIAVELFTDFSICEFIKHSDAVIIGADGILTNGNVINKTGSLALAVLAKENKVPFYVAATKNKFISGKKTSFSIMSSSEVWNYHHPKLKVHNKYFEVIDKKYITKILTD